MFVALGVAACAGIWWMISSSQGRSRSSGSRSFSEARQRTIGKGEALFDTVAGQLRDLPAYVDLELSPPSVILDATKSRDRKEVLAKIDARPDTTDDPPIYNFLFATSGNGRFRALGVKPGDIVKYFILRDEKAVISEAQIFGSRQRSSDEQDEEAEEDVGTEDMFSAEMARKVSIDLPVAQVINDNALLIAVSLAQPIPFEEKIQIWRYADRIKEIDRRLNRYHQRGMPQLGWEPSPDERVVALLPERLNQWLRQSRPDAAWKPSELLATLPKSLLGSEPFVAADELGKRAFQAHEGRLLQEAVWLRDISQWARGNGYDDLSRARALFDWTIRNVQLDVDDDALPYRPWQVLMYGHGTAAQRAWVFAALCRQQDIDTVVLPVVGDEGAEHLLVAVLVDERLAAVFDPLLGLPIPGSTSESIASLSELRADDSLLRALDLPDAPYPVTSAQLAEVVPQIVATRFELTHRARLIEQALLGDDSMALAVDPAAVAERLGKIAGIGAPRLWAIPFETIEAQLSAKRGVRNKMAAEFQPFAWRPTLWKARVLHFEGKRETKAKNERDALADPVNSHRDASQAYMSPRVRPPDRVLAQQTSEQKLRIYSTVKQRASYALGLLHYDEGRFEAAINWFQERTLKASPETRWANGARYNLARAYEALGQAEEAIELYENNESPQRHGNQLRARSLRQAVDNGDDPTTDEPQTTPAEQ